MVSTMTTNLPCLHLLLIDAQNDFCDLPAGASGTPALPVPGADADLRRVAELLRRAADRIDALTLTLDTHHRRDIAHPGFWWAHAPGQEVAPFTPITAAQVRAGQFQPRDPAALSRVLAYLDALEAQGRYETFGYAGFFGLPIALHRMGDTRRTRLLPVLLAPQHDVIETVVPGQEQAAAALPAREWDIDVLEMHHRHKVDAPSGTALLLGEAAARGRKINLADHSVRVRDGHTGPRGSGTIGFATLRGGSVIGEHTVYFAGEGEMVTLSHSAGDRSIFARGAVTAALWGRDKKPGYYSMLDVLGLSNS